MYLDGHRCTKTAALIEDAGSALRVVHREWNGLEMLDMETAEALASRVEPADLNHYRELILELEGRGVRLITILDDDYPMNLRLVYNPPPFLFVRGRLMPEDDHSVAVVGTRQPRPEGIAQAKQLAGDLARRSVTVLSGLAKGIDSAAHTAALEAGGRTVAVMGTGMGRIYPPENEGLAEAILGNGALVSQFWPMAPPTRYSFPMRNVVMSGMAVGTVVIERQARQVERSCRQGMRWIITSASFWSSPWCCTRTGRSGTPATLSPP